MLATATSCAVEEGCLDARESEPWIVCGIEAHACVRLTALDLAATGKQVFVVVDAIGSRATADKDIAQQRMSAAGITVEPPEMVFFELLGKAGTPEFKARSKKSLPSHRTAGRDPTT